MGYNLNAVAPNTASKTPTQNVYFVFDGWDKPFMSVTEDIMFMQPLRWLIAGIQ